LLFFLVVVVALQAFKLCLALLPIDSRCHGH